MCCTSVVTCCNRSLAIFCLDLKTGTANMLSTARQRQSRPMPDVQRSNQSHAP
jgi:hypothetical protein